MPALEFPFITTYGVLSLVVGALGVALVGDLTAYVLLGFGILFVLPEILVRL